MALAFVACKTEVDYALLKGKIENKGEAIALTLTNQDRNFKYEIPLAEDGSFQDTLFIQPGLYILHAGNRKSTDFVFFKGDDLTFTADADDFKTTMVFEGKGAKENNVLQAINTKIEAWKKDTPNNTLLDEKEFKSALSKEKDELLALLNESKELNPLFKEQHARNIDYWYIVNLMYYQGNHSYYAKNPEFKVSDDFLSEKNLLDYNIEDDYRQSSFYNTLVLTEYWRKADSIVKAGDSLSPSIARLKAATTFKSEYVRNNLLYSAVTGAIAMDNKFKDTYDAYMDLSTNNDHKTIVTEKYEQAKVLEQGSPSPKFIDYENYAGGTTSLDDLKGKYVYIDVWATWCGPCKAEIPFLKEVESKYHDNQNISFVSISVDQAKDHDKWKAMVKEKELTGIQLIAENAFRSSFIESYRIIGIPQFLLIGPDGNIVNRNAPRPSNPKLIDLFNELNI